jgi:hypothetical protein
VAYTLLKIASYGFAWIAPIVILVAASRWMHAKSVGSIKRRVIQTLLVPLVWILGLVGSFVGQAFHEAAWFAAHPGGICTEEDMMALGDYPNVFAGWVLLGWVPILVGLALAKRGDRNRQAEQAATPNRSLTPVPKSEIPVRGSEG